MIEGIEDDDNDTILQNQVPDALFFVIFRPYRQPDSIGIGPRKPNGCDQKTSALPSFSSRVGSVLAFG
jgi:hypothetical protein